MSDDRNLRVAARKSSFDRLDGGTFAPAVDAGDGGANNEDCCVV